MRLLLVEDDELCANELVAVLRRERFAVKWVTNGAQALEQLAMPQFDAVILDLGLPDMGGEVVLERARAAGLTVPLLVVTGRGDVTARIRSFELGADDHLEKPYAEGELLARLRTIVRRATGPRWAPLSCGRVILSRDEPGAIVAGRRVALSPRERALLELFLRRQGEILSHREILKHVFGYEFDPGTNIVVVHVSHLRHKLRGCGALIETIRGFGYRMTPECEM